MVVLVIIAVVCFSGGVWAATTWLAPLEEGTVGTLWDTGILAALAVITYLIAPKTKAARPN
jgi:hypothetical protein